VLRKYNATALPSTLHVSCPLIHRKKNMTCRHTIHCLTVPHGFLMCVKSNPNPYPKTWSCSLHVTHCFLALTLFFRSHVPQAVSCLRTFVHAVPRARTTVPTLCTAVCHLPFAPDFSLVWFLQSTHNWYALLDFDLSLIAGHECWEGGALLYVLLCSG
jgi:hypothetical protein